MDSADSSANPAAGLVADTGHRIGTPRGGVLGVQAGLFDLADVAVAGMWRGWLDDPATVRRFQLKVYRRGVGQCWFWLGAIASDGHGSFRAGSRTTGTSAVIAAHVFSHHLAHHAGHRRVAGPGLGQRVTDVVIRHHCDEASCQNPAHLGPGTRADNTTDWVLRRHRTGGPLQDRRGAAGRARAIRDAILAAAPTANGKAVQDAIATAQAAGDRHPGQQPLFTVARPGTPPRLRSRPQGVRVDTGSGAEV